LVKRLDVRTAVSEDARAMAQQALGGDYIVLFNGVEIDRIARTTPIDAEGPTIFFIGRHEPRKGLEVLLHAMAQLPANVRLWIASDGPDTARLKSMVAGDPRIEWLGRMSDEEKFARLRGATLFCAPSLRGESFGVVLLEAMAAHTPIVASNLPGYSKVARGGRDAVLVPPDDSDALAAALTSVITDRACASRLVESGIERAAQFSIGELADRYIDLYERAIAGSR
jgi:phosphatidyl-myo-inositol alpha-mannosyltransferase